MGRKDVFESICYKTTDSAATVVEPSSQPFIFALVLGGCLAAKSAATAALTQGKKKPSDEGASLQCELFTLALLSRWLAKMDEQTPHSSEDSHRARREWATAVMDAFGETSREPLTWFLNYDTQFRHEKESTKHGMAGSVVSHQMLLDMCLAAAGGRAAQIPGGGFPYDGPRDYIDRGGGRMTDPVAVVLILESIVDGYETSVKHYNRLHERAE